MTDNGCVTRQPLDVVSLLRGRAEVEHAYGDKISASLLAQAADEVERLRARRAELEEQLCAYAIHLVDCPRLVDSMGNCNCGLGAALEAIYEQR